MIKLHFLIKLSVFSSSRICLALWRRPEHCCFRSSEQCETSPNCKATRKANVVSKRCSKTAPQRYFERAHQKIQQPFFQAVLLVCVNFTHTVLRAPCFIRQSAPIATQFYSIFFVLLFFCFNLPAISRSNLFLSPHWFPPTASDLLSIFRIWWFRFFSFSLWAGIFAALVKVGSFV